MVSRPAFAEYTRLSMIFMLCLLVTIISFSAVSQAQLIDPYKRVSDPRAIADLNCDDCEPQIHRARYGLPQEVDEYGYHILAQDSGAGVITHIWSTTDAPDSSTEIRIYIDDKLAVSSQFYDFFLKRRGALRPPLDTGLAGGWVCDVQMPYRTGFRIAYKTQGYNVYYAIAWRPIKDQAKVKSFVLNPTPSEDSYQREAEKRMGLFASPWNSETQQRMQFDLLITPESSVTIAEISGSGMIQTLRLKPLDMNPWSYRSLYLKVYYDGSPYAAINAPLFDFFLSTTSIRNIDALQIKVRQDSGLISYLPMPFAKSIKIEIENRDTSAASILGNIAFSDEPIDRRELGYLHATFNESKPTRLGVYHPVLHVRGKGKFIGMYHAIPNCPFPVALEGDPIITVDSNAKNFLRYTGGEDYFNGGWWFLGVLYSRSFAGFTNFFDSFYRFHYLDAFDFKESFDFDLQHGVRNDVHNHYRTVAYYYKQWTPFWTDRDTIKAGEFWTISGTGYQPEESLTIKLGGFPIANVIADTKGTFSQVLTVDPIWLAGKYVLSVNDEEKPEWIFVLDRPALRTIADFHVPTLRERDTLLVAGSGFKVGEKITIYLDSIRISPVGAAEVGSDYRFLTTVRIPYLPDHEYHVVAVGEESGSVIAPHKVRLTRTHNIEFEKILPALAHSNNTIRRDDVSFFYHDRWSDQSIVYFEGTGRDSFVTFQFMVPRTDTFKVYMFATKGTNFGDYEYLLDDQSKGIIRGFRKYEHFFAWRSDTLQCGVLFLEEGYHTVTFKYIGKSDSANNGWLGADNIILEPTRSLPLAPGTWTQSVGKSPTLDRGVLRIYPNPSADKISIMPVLHDEDSNILTQKGRLSIVDASGRVVLFKEVTTDQLRLNPLTVALDGLANGAYMVSLTLAGSTQTKTYTAGLNVMR